MLSLLANGTTDFHQAGWPTMTLFAGLSFVALSIFYGMQRGKETAPNGSHFSIIFKLLNALNTIMGVFLIFGPGEPGPRVNVLGFQIIIGSALGFYTIFTNLKACAQAMLVYVTVTIFCLVGCFPLLNHSAAVFTVDQMSCIGYFGSGNINFNRCLDSGYLQLIRTFSLFALFFLTVQMCQLFLLVTEGATTIQKASTDATDSAAHLLADQYAAPQSGSVPVAQPYAAPNAGVAAVGPGYQAL